MMEVLLVNHYQPAQHSLAEDPQGGLIFRDKDGVLHRGVTPVRAFPLDAAGEDISLLGKDGHELAWIPRLAELDAASRTLISDELARRDFMPQIKKLETVSSFGTPSTWSVITDRGRTQFVLKGEEDIRRLRGRALLITDSHGVTYQVADLLMLDRISRRLLDRFL